MADVITRFKLETTQFDSKLRDSAQSLSQLTRHLQLAGKDFDRFAQQHVEAARSFGQVASGATNLKDELKDLVGAYNKVANAYNALTQEQKQSDYGKAMAASLQQLQGRIKDVKSEMNSAPGMLDKLAEKFTVNIDAIKLFNVGLQVAEGALNVAKDAFFNNEENLDEWGRTVESCESVYRGFLNSINTGDISGFLSNIQTITQSARDAYDALDELATFNAFNKVNIASARADLTGSIADFREGKGGKDDVSKASEALIKELQTKQKLQEEAYKKVIAKVAAERGVKESDLMKVMTGNYGTFKELKDLQYTGRKTTMVATGGTFTSGPTYRQVTEVVPANEREKLAQAIKHLNDTEIDNFQSLAEAAKMTEIEINNQRKMVARVLNGKQGGSIGSGGGSGRGGKGGNTKAEVKAVSGSIDAQTKKVQELQKAWRAAADDDSRQKIKAEIEEQQFILDRMTGKEKFDPTKMGPIADLTGRVPMPDFGVDMKRGKNGKWYDATAPVAPSEIKFSDSLQKFMDYMEKLQVDDYKKRQSRDGLDDTKKVVSGLGQVASGLQQMGIELPKGVQQVLGMINGLMTVIEGVNTIIGVTQTTTLSANTAAMVALTSALYANTAVSAIPFFAHGGVVRAAVGYEVPGNHFSGDMVPALLNSGETVLNRAQSGVLAAQLEGVSGSGGGTVRTVLSGEQCYLMIDRYARRTGKGEMVFWR